MKLTKSIREDILDALLAESFGKEFEELTAARHALAAGVYRTIISASLEKRCDELNDIMPGLVNHNAVLYPCFSDWHYSRYDLASQRPFPSSFNWKDADRKFGPETPECVEHERLSAASDDLFARQAKAKAAAATMLASANTVSRLCVIWPEIKDIVESVLPPTATNLPAIPVADLNQMFGLPKETAETAA